MKSILAVVGAGIIAALPQQAQAQQASITRIVGRETSGTLDIKPRAQTTETFRLRFGASESPATFDVDFVAQYASQGPRSAPAVVDIVVTEHKSEDGQPAIGLSIDGAPMPVVARARQARSVVTSLAFDDFMRIARAGAVVQRAFDTDLVFGDGQLRMLRLTAEKWAAR